MALHETLPDERVGRAPATPARRSVVGAVLGGPAGGLLVALLSAATFATSGPFATPRATISPRWRNSAAMFEAVTTLNPAVQHVISVAARRSLSDCGMRERSKTIGRVGSIRSVD